MRSSKTEAGLSLLGGALLGAAAMYLLDPESGRRRRERLGEIAEDKLGPAWDTARAASAALAEKAGDFSAHLSDRAHDFATNASSRAGDAADAIGDSGSGLFDTLRHFGRRTVSRASDAAGSAADYASDFGSDLAERARRQSHASPAPPGQGDRPRARPRPGHAVGWTTAGFGTPDARRRAHVRARPRARPRPPRVARTEDHEYSERLRHDVPPHRPRPHEPRPRHHVRGPRRPTEPARASSEDADGERLLQRVRSEIGHVVTYPTAIQLMADANGTVTVYGRVPSSEEDRLLSCIHAVPGVREIINRVEACSPEDFAGSYRTGGSSYATGSNPGSGTSGYSVPPM